MKRIYSKPLFRLFEAGLKLRWPEFKRFKISESQSIRRSYCWEIEGVTNIFLELFVDPKGHESFYCEFLWTRLARYPSVATKRSEFPIENPKAAFDYPECVEGIQRLWRSQGIGAWEIPDPVSTFRAIEHAGRDGRNMEAAMAEMKRRVEREQGMTEAEGEGLVAPLVGDLFIRLEQYAVPYLRAYADYARGACANKNPKENSGQDTNSFHLS